LTLEGEKPILFGAANGYYQMMSVDEELQMNFLETGSEDILNAYSIEHTTDPNNLFNMSINGNVIAHNITNMTVTHETEISYPELGRFCEITGELHDYGQNPQDAEHPYSPRPIGIIDCIGKMTLATNLSTKVFGIITANNCFASHGDVLVIVDEGEYHIGDMLVPTLTGSRVATDEDKLFIMLNGLPRVRITCVDGNVLPKINDKVCVACFIS
jgi:hypothetical protein